MQDQAEWIIVYGAVAICGVLFGAALASLFWWLVG